jgi:hypothetical protein
MAEDGRVSVAALLWSIAFVSLALAAALTPADARGVVGLVVVGHLLWGLAFVLARRGGATSELVVQGQRFVVGMLTVAGVLDLIVLIAACCTRDEAVAIWSGVALSFVAAGMANTHLAPPSDGVLGCQVFFHVLTMLATAPILMMQLLPADNRTSPALLKPAEEARVMFLSTAVLIPFLFSALITMLLYRLSRPRAEREFTWTTMLAHQAAYLFIALRWLASWS